MAWGETVRCPGGHRYIRPIGSTIACPVCHPVPFRPQRGGRKRRGRTLSVEDFPTQPATLWPLRGPLR